MTCGRKIGEFDCCSVVEGDIRGILPAVPSNSIYAVFTSPPYGLNRPYSEKFSDTLDYVSQLVPTLFREAARFIVSGGSLTINFDDLQVQRICVAGDYYRWGKESDFVLEARRIWKKDPAWMNCQWVGLGDIPVLEWEYVWTWRKGKPRRLKGFKPALRSIWEIRSVNRNKNHPAQFPEELSDYVLNTYTVVGDIVLEPFAGSGATLLSAKKLGRHFLGIDIEPKLPAFARP